MKNLRGIIVAAVFLALTVILKIAAEHFGLLVGMAYPFASKTFIELMAAKTGVLDFCLWQVILALYLLACLVGLALAVLFRKNLLRWLGWVLAPASVAVFLFTAIWGINYYNKPLEDSMKMPVKETYSVEELKEAAVFYRQQAEAVSAEAARDENGDLRLPALEQMNDIANQAYTNLVWKYSVFAGPKITVKELGWKDQFHNMGVDGVAMALTGEAAVNLNQYPTRIPFNICHEIAHLLAIAREDEANFAAYLACDFSKDPTFRYSGNLEAFLFCADRLYEIDRAAWSEVWRDASDTIRRDVERLNQVQEQQNGTAQQAVDAVNNAYLQSNGQEEGVKTYSHVTDLLVAWYQDQYVVDTTPPPTEFNPLNYDDVFGAKTTESTEPTETTKEG